MASDDGEDGGASSSSSSHQELTASASIPQFAPPNSSGPLSDDGSSTNEKDKRKTPVRRVFSVLSDWVMWFLRVWAKYSPLLAAVAAPMSTLLDIPALAQPWYVDSDGEPIPDPKTCVALSSTSLALNVVAMVLLLLRFSTFQGIWQRAANLSIVFWMLKTIVALCNLFIFGVGEPRPDNSDFSEGFWSAVFSVLIAGSITIALFLHWLLGMFRPFDSGDDKEFRLTGRKFLLSVTGFTVLVGLEALAFSQLENWRYLDAIYFSVQTALTVGYGDITVQTAPGKVLLFIFAVLTLAQLGNAVSITIDWVQSRAVERRQKWLKKYSIAVHGSAVRRKPYATLIDEIALLHQINLHQESLIQMWDLIWALFSMFTFWCLGAMVFYFVEGWGYGNALYSVMVMSFTIGYGDYTPATAAGRVFWVCYALMAVPVVTNFAVQTVTGILYTLTQHQFTNDMLSIERDRDPETFAPHSHFVLRHHRRWEKVRRLYIDSLKEAGYMDEEPSDDDSHSGDQPSANGTAPNGKPFDAKFHDHKHGDHRLDDHKHDDHKHDDHKHDDEKHDDDHHETMSDGIPSSIKPDEEDRMVESVLDRNTHPSAKEQLLDKAVKSLVNGKHGDKADADGAHHKSKGGYDENEWLNEPLRREQIEFYLLKQLIGRVTRLEAQARQMLIDSMDKDLAQTLLVADRNLQIRDAFQLYGDGDEEDDALKASEDTEKNRRNQTTEAQQEHIRQLEQETNLISGDSYDDDMLTRVRRYRSTFAEILVLSSTLLGLEGDDLKRFERWHIQLEGGSYRKWHHQRFKNLTRPPHSRRKKLEQKLRRRNMDTEGKVRPPGYAPPGERDPPEFVGKHKGRHRHRGHHRQGQRASRSDSRLQDGTVSDTPHVDQAEAEGRLSDGGSLRSSRSRSSASQSHDQHAKKDQSDKNGKGAKGAKENKKVKAKLWSAMEDELFRRTDKNVEDIIRAIPDEEEKEYLDKEAFARQLLMTSAERRDNSDARMHELEKEARRGELDTTGRGRQAAHEAESQAKHEIVRDAGPSQHFDRAGQAERGEGPSIDQDGERDAAYGPNVWDTESDDEGDSDDGVDTDDAPDVPDGPDPDGPAERDFAYAQPSRPTKQAPARQPERSPPAQPTPRSRKPQDPRKAREAELRRNAQHARLDDVLNTMNAGPDHMHPYAPPGAVGYAGAGPHLEDEAQDRSHGEAKADPVMPLSKKVVGGL